MIGQLEGLPTQFPFQCALTPIGDFLTLSLGTLKLLLFTKVNIVAIGLHLELAV